ncbi:MAG: amidophosphoribosyltransferase [Omnitrophica WOR_2 bacterium SM23_29]|nr:MAG: amidophosphoribosyltransferase [Omnitrophica WOR_2 bacterium SM23_29]
MDEKIKENCGLFGIYGHNEAARLTFLGLYALQHRGEESAGIASFDGNSLYSHKGMGLVSDVFDEEKFSKLRGHVAIGHVRYSTTGSTTLKNAQPVVVDYSRGVVAIGHNGNLVNGALLRTELEARGSIFQTTLDSEIIVHLLARSQDKNFEKALIYALKQIEGAFSLVILKGDQLIGVRDPHGLRPLCLGKLGNAYILSSETCALDLIEAKFVREVEPGEVLFINKNGTRSIKPFGERKRLAHCIFEHIYFARPDSYIFGEYIHLVRQNLGRKLAKEYPVNADLIIPIPDSGTPAALGFSHQSKIPLEMGIIRNHYVGRTFIQPSQHIRDFNVKVKFNPIKGLLKGKRIIVVDDSIVRGTTSRARLKNLLSTGVKEVHMRISCPPIRYPCFYGIDFPTRKELIAATHSIEEIRKFLGVTSLGYLSLEGLLSSVSCPKDYCTACFTGDYPVPFGGEGDKYATENKGY